MLHIIGFLLKCIGVLLAVILGIIVLLICAVLFAPIRYEGNASFPGKIEEAVVKAKVTWLMHLIRADVAWEDSKLDWRVRAAWKIFDGKEKEPQQTKSKEKADTVKTAPKQEKKAVEKKSTEKTVEKTAEKIADKTAEKTAEKIADKTGEKTAEKTKEKTPEKKEPVWEKIIKKIKYTFKKIYDKIKEGMDLKDKIMGFLQNKAHQAAFSKLKKELIWLKRFFKITDGNIKLRFGFEDPALTGKVLAVLSMIYPLIEGNMDVTPEFEEQCIEGQVYLKGRLRIIHLVMLAVKLLIDKNVRQTIKDIMEWKESL